MKRTIVLSEYQTNIVPQGELEEAVAHRLWQACSRLVTIEFPTPKTHGQWQLTALGWVGMVPLTSNLTLVLEPKVPIAHLLQMIEIAFGLQDLQLLRGLVDGASIADLYEGLALLLARGISKQCRRGLYRPYERCEATSPFVRGRLQIDELIRQPTPSEPPCVYHEQRVDVVDNQILRWTLLWMLKSELWQGQGESALRRTLRQALRALHGVTTPRPFTAADCRGRHYSRLNEAYAQLHALCAFFLEASSPSHLPGENESVPFVINMAQLYEQFVAAWLQQHLPDEWQLQIQERHPLDGRLHFAIDLVLYDRAQAQPLAVLDTKYKVPEQGPDTADIAQVVAYAAAKGVSEALLIYPQSLHNPLDATVGGVHVRTIAFQLDINLDSAGQQVLRELEVLQRSLAA